MYEDIEKILNEDTAVSQWEATFDGWVFRLKGIDTEILLQLYVNPVHGGYNFELSHYIHTPTQIGPYHPSRPWGDDMNYAFRQALSAVTSYYQEAIAKGHSPKEGWLIADKP